MFWYKLISFTSKLITYRSKLKIFILIDLFEVYIKLKLILLRSKLKNAQKIKNKRKLALHVRIAPVQINDLSQAFVTKLWDPKI